MAGTSKPSPIRSEASYGPIGSSSFAPGTPFTSTTGGTASAQSGRSSPLGGAGDSKSPTNLDLYDHEPFMGCPCGKKYVSDIPYKKHMAIFHEVSSLLQFHEFYELFIGKTSVTFLFSKIL